VRDYCGVATRVRASAGAAAGTRVPVSPMPLALRQLHIMTCEAHTTLTHMTREERRGAPAAPYRVLTTSRPRETET
jgi:hypothetical protein